MKQLLSSLFLVGVVLLGSAAPVAARVQPACPQASFHTADMGGVYENEYMRLIVEDCGYSSVLWLDRYGDEHLAFYYGVGRVPTGGILFMGVVPDDTTGRYLDSVPFMGVKPAERNWVEIQTVDRDFTRIVRVYRLYKWE